MRVALFLTTELAGAMALVGRVRQQFPGATVTAFVRDEHREALAPLLTECDVRRDKPAGGKLQFVRALRRERFDAAVVAWHGGERLQPLRLVALVCGARRVVAVDERWVERDVCWYRPWTWAGHALRRLAHSKPMAVLRLGAAVYRCTIGLAVAVILLLPAAARMWRIGEPGRRS
jgi:hypothetical protein